MMELIRNAWLLGWPDYTSDGKFAALLLIALVIYWFVRKELQGKYNTLAIYTTIMTICCICPLTAAVLMSYQTRFYDYQWIWNLVPVTIFIALAGTLLWTELMQKCSGPKGRKLKCIGVTVAMLAIIYLCGRMGNTVWNADEEAAKRQETARVLATITENGQETDINLWAPQGIMEYARALDGNIRLPYGRNMWDISLNAYTYDTYGVHENILYAWMSNLEGTGEGEATIEIEVAMVESEYESESSVVPEMKESTVEQTITGIDCTDIAAELGVTHILLPGNILPETLAEMEEYLHVEAEEVEGYYLLRMGDPLE